MAFDSLFDEFVRYVNRSEREPVMASDSPGSVLVGEPNELGFSDWKIRLFPNVTWVAELEERLPARYPAAYRSLISRYIYPGFQGGGIFFFANTPEGTDWLELRTRTFNDPILSKVLLSNRLLPFGLPDEANYDQICFDAGRRNYRGDCPIVVVDHKAVLQFEKIRIIKELSPSFSEWITNITGGSRAPL